MQKVKDDVGRAATQEENLSQARPLKIQPACSEQMHLEAIEELTNEMKL
jgi:hypothetical protein